MNEQHETSINKELTPDASVFPLVFIQRLDIYGQGLAIYLIIFIVYIAFRGTIDSGEFSIHILNPIGIMMLAIVVISLFSFLLAAVKRKKIFWYEDYLEIKNNFHIKRIRFVDISMLKISNSPTRLIKGEAGFVRIKIEGKKKIVFIRTASYWHDKELLKLFHNLKSSKYNTTKKH